MNLRPLLALPLALSSVGGLPAQPAAPAVAAPAADNPADDLKNLVTQVRAKLRTGAPTAASLAPELAAFDALLAKYAAQKTDNVAQILFMKATLYGEVLKDLDQMKALFAQLQAGFPGTKPAAAADRTLGSLERRAQADKASAHLVGQPAPALHFKWSTRDGLKTLADLRGKVVVLDFWATWCGPCQQAMPHYEEIHRKYADKGVVILGVCAFDTRANYDKWLGETKGKYTFATVFDPVGKPASGDKEAMDRTIMKQLSQGVVSPLPTTLVINPAGQLVGSYVGYGEGTHTGLANLLMLAGVPLADADKPKIFFPAGSTRQSMPAATIQAKTDVPAAAAPKPATLGAGAVAPDFL
ncbi:MAG: TlpA disulfide reductase family protein, partial [Verrucomicrobia bacterium]|nr:TlpA disulfide reductase family protein [Verrucomicrobiota bacterium]